MSEVQIDQKKNPAMRHAIDPKSDCVFKALLGEELLAEREGYVHDFRMLGSAHAGIERAADRLIRFFLP